MGRGYNKSYSLVKWEVGIIMANFRIKLRGYNNGKVLEYREVAYNNGKFLG